MMSSCSGCVSILLADAWLEIEDSIVGPENCQQGSIIVGVNILGSVLRIPVACRVFVCVSPR